MGLSALYILVVGIRLKLRPRQSIRIGVQCSASHALLYVDEGV